MRAILGEHTHTFKPEMVEVLVGAFDDAWKVAEATEGLDTNRESWRLILAQQVIAIAQEGETDRATLSVMALERFARILSI